ncbi:MAG: bifunctional diaminohydroxyphosphoribosylaminopyrimidine deaminase/5-amino-6-(5-phosphoribosylamino)uracil reductase RibD [Tannerellaceae bacterium]|jgi:diaminohydroxyphosphoribosylaminopyrimidine deaminase/5-amino-6-(5-phosphoribosylamino)uracil reductase|nr:bifunctional diaminohydroxyphosphoribosylaminopyrimidine deaminase/5-amino-6-(5-phosphoribosylamino)uracil reductase RibD [Tannerellaceae bacterium]
MEKEEIYMLRCINLAMRGAGRVNPNPMVGAVIVHNDRIIGEGFHRKYGEAHAEVNAINSVRDRRQLKQSTIYVNLEPCCHQGKTPPCADLIIREGIPRVVVACRDPYPEVSGGGVRRLREAGVEVITGMLEEQASDLNRVFLVSHTHARPYIYLKWAQSADGFIDRIRNDASTPPVVFSSPEMLQTIHRKRSEMMAIMVGTRTALLDNPSLTVRLWSGTSPVRVVLDRRLSIPSTHNIFNNQAPSIIFTALEHEDIGTTEYVRIDFDANVLQQVLSHLYACRLTSLMVEGGSRLLTSFIGQDLWDEIQVETSPILLRQGVKAPALPFETP